MPLHTKPFYITVTPRGSRFARLLQQELRNRVTNKIYRVNHQRAGRLAARKPWFKSFKVTHPTLNKIEQLNAFNVHNVPCPPFTTDPNQISGLGTEIVFARRLVNATNGRGIVEFKAGDPNIPQAPLYTGYIKKKAEYRVHVMFGEVIDVQQKKKARNFEGERDTRIRNANNGYVYCRDGINPPDGLHDVAIRAVAACGYSYGAVDVIYNERNNQLYALEVNSRPGLMGTTITKYVSSLIKFFELRIR